MLRIARIEKIINEDRASKYFTALITWLDMDGGFYDDVSMFAEITLSYGYISRSFGIQYMPIPGDIVLCGFLNDDIPIILSYLSVDYYTKVMHQDKAYGYYFREIVQGEYVIKGLRGNELYFDRKGSLRFIVRDQALEKELTAKNNNSSTLDVAHYLSKLNKDVDLTKQVLDAPKVEVTFGKVYDEEYNEEQLLDGKSIDLQIEGNKNSLNSNGDIVQEKTYTIRISEDGDIQLKKSDGSYNIHISSNGEININTDKIKINNKNEIDIESNIVNVKAKQVVMENTALPNGKGSFCALPQCLFTGATHIGSIAKE